MEDQYITRGKKILSILEQEIEDGEEMAGAVRHIAERLLLGEKGYSTDDIRKNVSFEVTLEGRDRQVLSGFRHISGKQERHGDKVRCGLS